MKKTYEPDPRPAKRVKNPKAMKNVHARGCTCVLNCGHPGETHHVLSKGQGGDDVEENLVCLCLMHHGYVTGEDEETRRFLGEYLLFSRPDTIFYVRQKLGEERGAEWLRRRLFIS